MGPTDLVDKPANSAPDAPVAPDAPAAPDASASARLETPGELRRDLADLSAGASAKAEAASGREGGPVAPVLALADAFELLLAVEQGELPPLTAAPTGLSDRDIDRIASRVAERLTNGLLHDTVTRVVAETSERLVRDEIARIRAAAAKAT